jgi:hypothetical protein
MGMMNRWYPLKFSISYYFIIKSCPIPHHGTAFLACIETNAMADEKDNPATSEEQNRDQNTEDRFVSDTQKLTRKHLEDEDHVITDEEMEKLRIGMTPPQLDEATKSRFRDEKALEEAAEKFIGTEEERKENDEDTDKPGQKITPWDTINP